MKCRLHEMFYSAVLSKAGDRARALPTLCFCLENVLIFSTPSKYLFLQRRSMLLIKARIVFPLVSDIVLFWHY